MAIVILLLIERDFFTVLVGIAMAAAYKLFGTENIYAYIISLAYLVLAVISDFALGHSNYKVNSLIRPVFCAAYICLVGEIWFIVPFVVLSHLLYRYEKDVITGGFRVFWTLLAPFTIIAMAMFRFLPWMPHLRASFLSFSGSVILSSMVYGTAAIVLLILAKLKHDTSH